MARRHPRRRPPGEDGRAVASLTPREGGEGTRELGGDLDEPGAGAPFSPRGEKGDGGLWGDLITYVLVGVVAGAHEGAGFAMEEA